MRKSFAYVTAALLGWLVFVPMADAQEPSENSFSLETEEYMLAIRRHELSDFSRVIGWQVRENVFFGRQQGDEDAFGFLWQRTGSQISLTNKGLSWHKRLGH